MEGTAVNRQWVAPLAIFSLALVLRLVYVFLLKHTLLWDAMMVDAELYDTWRMKIASGDWIGKKIFYDPPLYAYFLGIIYKTFGHSYLVTRIIQAFIGSVHCVIIYFIGARIFDRRAGIVAGVIAALYGPLVFYDAAIMKAFLSSALVDGGILVLLAAMKSGRLGWWFLHGLCLGLVALLRLNMLMFAVVEAILFAGAIIWGKWRGGRVKAALSALLWVVGFGLALAPVAARNWYVSGDVVLVSSYLGQNFYTGNNPFNSTGNYQRLPFVRANPRYEEQDFYREAVRRLGTKDLTPSQVSDYWLSQGVLYIKAQLAAFVKRLLLRLRIFWNSYEMPDCYNIDFIGRNFTPILRLLPGFGVVAPLGLLGIILTWGRRRDLWVFYLFIAAYCGSLMLFFVFSRYRMPVVGTLIAFASAALVWIWDARGRRLKPAAALAAALVLVVLVNIPLPSRVRVPDSGPLRNIATLLQKRHQPELAVKYYRKAISINPREYESHYFLAYTLRELGDCDGAMEEYRIALRLRPRDPSSLAGMGMCCEAGGDDEEARGFYEKALDADAGLTDVRLLLIKLLMRHGKYREARRQIITLGVIEKMNSKTLTLLEEVDRKIEEGNK